MPLVEAYGKTLEFPDDMSHEDMANVIKKTSIYLIRITNLQNLQVLESLFKTMFLDLILAVSHQ